jgi:hypothetical protein
MDLQALHHLLRLHFKQLADERATTHPGRATFLIEHPLTEVDRARAEQEIRRALREHPLADEPFWNGRYLGVLILVVEHVFSTSGPPEALWRDLSGAFQTPLEEAEQRIIATWLRLEAASFRRRTTPEPPELRLPFREAFLPAACQRLLAALLLRWAGVRPSPPLAKWLARQVEPLVKVDASASCLAAVLEEPGVTERLTDTLAGLQVRDEDAAGLELYERSGRGLRVAMGSDGEQLIGPSLKVAAAKRALASFQGQLAARYGDLQSMRAQQGVAVYAVEHPLDLAAIETVEGAIRILRRYSPDDIETYWLCVVALAADVAFDFEKSYWPLLLPRVGVEEPGQEFKDSLKRWFERFADEYGGPRPLGPWALQFNQICWPVANAVLARAFRRDLTRLLLDSAPDVEERLDLAAFQPRYFAKILKSRLTNPSERFRIFCDDDALVEFAARCLLGIDAPGVVLDPALQERILVALRGELAAAMDYQAGSDLEALRTRTRQRSDRAAAVRYAAQRHDGRWYLQGTLERFGDADTANPRLRYVTAQVGPMHFTAARLLGEPMLLADRRIAACVRLSAKPMDEALCERLTDYLEDIRVPSRILFRLDPEDQDLAVRTRALAAGATYLLLTTGDVGEPWRSTSVGTEGMEGYLVDADAANVRQAAVAAGLPVQAPPPIDVWVPGWPRQDDLLIEPDSASLLAVRSGAERRVSLVVRAGRAGPVVWESQRTLLTGGSTRCLALPQLPVGHYAVAFRLDHDQLSLASVPLIVEPRPPRTHSGAVFVLQGPGFAETEFIEELTSGKTIEVHGPEGIALNLRLEAWEGVEAPEPVRCVLQAAKPVCVSEQFQASLPGGLERAWKAVVAVEAGGQTYWQRDFLREKRVRWVKVAGSWDLVDQRFAGPDAPPIELLWARASEPWKMARSPASEIPRPFAPGLYVLRKTPRTFNLAGVAPVVTTLPPPAKIFEACRQWIDAAQLATGSIRRERLRLARACVGALTQVLVGAPGGTWYASVEGPALAGRTSLPAASALGNRAGQLREWAEGDGLRQGRKERIQALSGFLDVNQPWVEALAMGLSLPRRSRWEPDVDSNIDNLGDWAKRLSQVPTREPLVTGVRIAVLWIASAASAAGQELEPDALYHGWGPSFWRW